jgi:hypothetical protein
VILDGGFEQGTPVHVRINPANAVRAIRENWLRSQIEYHQKSFRKFNRMHECTERAIEVLNWTVLAVVLTDLAIFGVEARLHEMPWTRWTTVGLLFFAAVLPAAVASLNGVRFQSEIVRLTDRSRMTKRILSARSTDASLLLRNITEAMSGPDDPGGWTLEALDLAESCAQLTTDEVAEWSVLYSKDVAEP